MRGRLQYLIGVDSAPETLEAHRMQGPRLEQALRRQALHRIEDPRLDENLTGSGFIAEAGGERVGETSKR